MLKEMGKAREGESMRSTLETYIDALFVVDELSKSGGAKRINIMYKANLSWRRLQKRLDYMVGEGLVEETYTGRARLYRITNRGRETVERCKREGASCLADVFKSVVRVKRNKLEMRLDVLRAIKNGEKKPTRIMYKSSLSPKPFKKTLIELIKQGFVEETVYVGDTRRYGITKKGKKVLGDLD